jgi:hypothetical protein
MTNQPNSNAPQTKPASGYFRNADGRWNVMPIALGALLVASAGYLLWNDQFTGQVDSETPALEKTMK